MSAGGGKGQRPIDVDGVICNLAAIVRVHEGNRCPSMNKLIESDVPKAREAVAVLVEALTKAVQHIEDMTTLYAHDLCHPDQVKSSSQRIQESGGTVHASCVVTQSGRAALRAAGVL